MKIDVLQNGPLLINEKTEIRKPDGTIEHKEKVALCRCGSSENKPYCDGAHNKTGFKG